MLIPKLIVFDWDGTIADSIPRIIECKQILAKKHSLPIPTGDLIRSVIGQDFRQAMSVCYPSCSKELLTQLMHEFRQMMLRSEFQAPLFDNAITTLTQLKKDHHLLAIATSKSRIELNTTLNTSNLHELFTLTCCAEEHKSKPNPDMLHFIMHSLQVAPTATLMVGDAVVDMEFAHNANVPVAAFTQGAASQASLAAYKPVGLFAEWKNFYKDVLEKC